ncbi:phenylacetate--CoA ligase family protein [Fodinibius halophilus]|uniref:Phenylacetate--CoA ligase family protein n=1 Tax=Fodinibius halophilus TaxID=1736908 RepID=A0A6M1T2Q3_9BACT|nr:phenylacetate--CoA ligase family protein [Fodinibius halophilus]NGP88317.1 phenylacetate--CoA ligase family protein [Fodinibius halophilus]
MVFRDMLRENLPVDNIREVIINLPNWVKRYLLYLNTNPNVIFGKDFKEYSNFLENQWKSYDNTNDLLEIANYALNQTPYYANRYNNLEISDINDFRKIETISKEDIKEHFDQFISREIDLNKYELVTTSGTTGKALEIYLPKKRYVYELATKFKLWSQVGYNYSIRGRMRMSRLDEGKKFDIDPIRRSYNFDGFRLNDEYFFEVYEIMKEKDINFFHCYTSTGYEFAKFLERNNLDHSFIKAFISSSENVYQHQEKYFKRNGITHYNFYGHTEKMMIGGICPNSGYYHVEPTYGYCEIIDDQGNVITERGQTGQIVATSLHNYGMPLLRYETGDYAEYHGRKCEHCGRELLVLSNISGRKGEKVYNADGTFVSTTSLTMHGDLLKKIDGFQMYQEEMGHLEVHIVPSENYKDNDLKLFKTFFENRFKSDMKIDLKTRKKLKRKPNGKFLLLMSSID